MGAFLRNSFAHVDNVIPVFETINHMAAPIKVARQQTHRNSPEPEPCLRNLRQHAPELFVTLQNLPNPISGTYSITRRNSSEFASGTYHSSGTCSYNPHRHIPELIRAKDPINLRC